MRSTKRGLPLFLFCSVLVYFLFICLKLEKKGSIEVREVTKVVERERVNPPQLVFAGGPDHPETLKGFDETIGNLKEFWSVETGWVDLRTLWIKFPLETVFAAASSTLALKSENRVEAMKRFLNKISEGSFGLKLIGVWDSEDRVKIEERGLDIPLVLDGRIRSMLGNTESLFRFSPRTEWVHRFAKPGERRSLEFWIQDKANE